MPDLVTRLSDSHRLAAGAAGTLSLATTARRVSARTLDTVIEQLERALASVKEARAQLAREREQRQDPALTG